MPNSLFSFLSSLSLSPYHPSCQCTQPFLAILTKEVLFIVFVAELAPLVSSVFIIFVQAFSPSNASCHCIRHFFVIFVEIVTFFSFVDHMRLFVIFVFFAIACNPEHLSFLNASYLSRARRCRSPPELD